MARPQRRVPWCEKRGDVYYAFRYDPETRRTERTSLRTTDEDEAQARFAALLQEGSTVFGRAVGSALSVTAALDQYWTEHGQNCAAADRQEDAIAHLKAFFGDTPLEDVNIPMCRNYADARRKGLVGGGSRRKDKTGSDSTIRRELSVLSAASNHAKRWERIERVPSIERPAERRLGPDDEAPYFTKDELALLRTKASAFAADRAESVVARELPHFIELAYWTGARRRSIENLTWDQVRYDQNRILLQKPGKRTTKKRQPIVPLLAEMRPALTALGGEGSAGPVFQTSDFYRAFTEVTDACGFGDRKNPHLLRHSRATHLLQAGVPIYTVARLLGDTVATVERVYGHHSVGYIESELGGK